MIINGFMNKTQYDDEQARRMEAEKAAKAVVSSYDEIHSFDKINVIIRTGFNIGIANFNLSDSFPFSADGTPLPKPSK